MTEHYDLKAMRFSAERAKAWLECGSGNPLNSLLAFDWDKTPQGDEFWNDRDGHGLDKPARSALRDMLAQWEAEQAVSPPDGQKQIDLYIEKKARQATAKGLADGVFGRKVLPPNTVMAHKGQSVGRSEVTDTGFYVPEAGHAAVPTSPETDFWSIMEAHGWTRSERDGETFWDLPMAPQPGSAPDPVARHQAMIDAIAAEKVEKTPIHRNDRCLSCGEPGDEVMCEACRTAYLERKRQSGASAEAISRTFNAAFSRSTKWGGL